MEVCPYLEETFKIIGRSWNGLILNYLSRCPEKSAHFSEMKKDLKTITPRSLSLKLTELMEWDLVEKNIVSKAPVSIVYQLTDKGAALAEALVPMEEWAQKYVELEQEHKAANS
ncbi:MULTISPECIES: winged helix-turn-helix transcriptional regulator [Staphylococcus]|uniref:winged helix-turn-helix transcriptional regulator n=1 Tax=Staphylococcus TaxID=1279 RepID=UPI000D025A42|nr:MULTISPECIES: helix-turn-helix domain-containing protein [Staphylococcus]MCD8916199.1 helix-turn-helix transcriptional regulator [Staphylococcus simulans]UXV35770.1 helix-turn-helix transcriptional regulator [Staphylococcus sp. IVB6181]